MKLYADVRFTATKKYTFSEVDSDTTYRDGIGVTYIVLLQAKKREQVVELPAMVACD